MVALRSRLDAYTAIAATVPKQFMVYRVWFWMEFFVQILAMLIFVYFWRAVYAGVDSLGGLQLHQTLNYILLAQIMLPVLQSFMIFTISQLVRSGQVGVELLRPLDFQLRYYVENLTGTFLALLIKLPLFIVAYVFFGLRLPLDPLLWGAFLVTLLLGQGVLFFFDWIFSCLAFYTTETWGLAVLREGVAAFFSGALLPLVMMPLWLQNVAQAMPFAQVMYVPVSLLSGIVPLSEAPSLWLVQLAWLVGLALVSRLVFRVSVKKVTVQGG